MHDVNARHLYLVHHGDAIGPEVDLRRPLSPWGRQSVVRLAAAAAARGVRPAVVWHSGKLRAKQTAEEFWRACNAMATFAATRDLQPGDPPAWMRDRVRVETSDILIAGHYPHLPRLLTLLVTGQDDGSILFPPHGVVALESQDLGASWTETWRLSESGIEGLKD